MKKISLFLLVITILFIVTPMSSCFADTTPEAPIEGSESQSNGSAQRTGKTPEASIGGIVDDFQKTVKGIEAQLKKYAKSLFVSLAMLQFVYNMAMLVVNGKADMQSFAANLVRQIMIIGIFAFFLNNGPDLFNVIIKSFRMAAAGSGKLPPDVTPGGIYAIGMALTEKLKDVAWENTGFFFGSIGYFGYFYIALVCFVMFLSFAVITAVYTLTLIKTYFICTAGMLFLGFGGSEWSNDIAKST